MATFKAFLVLEFKRFFSKRNIVLMLFVILLCGYFVNKGIKDYRQVLRDSEEFQKNEKLMFEQIRNYTHYSFVGVKVMAIPPASSVFFPRSHLISSLVGKVDSIKSIDLFTNVKGKSLISRLSKLNFGFSNIILLIGSLAFIMYGLHSFRNLEYLRFMGNKCTKRAMFYSIVTSRVIILICSLLLTLSLMIGYAIIKGHQILLNDYISILCYTGVLFLVLLLVFLLGVCIGLFFGKNGTSITISLWVLLIIFFPAIIETIAESKIKNIPSSYSVDILKQRQVNIFENQSEKEKGKFDRKRIEDFKKSVEHYYDKVLPTIHKLENDYKGILVEHSEKVEKIYAITPVSNLNLIVSNFSGEGPKNVLNFYGHLIAKHKKFVRFYIDMCFSGMKIKEIKPFENGVKKIFALRPTITGNTLLGVGLNLIYCISLLWLAHSKFRRKLLLSKPHSLSKSALEQLIPTPGSYKVILAKNSTIVDVLYYDIFKLKPNSFYICHPLHLKINMKVGHLLKFYGMLSGNKILGNPIIPYTKNFDVTLKTNLSCLRDIDVGIVLLNIASEIDSDFFLFNYSLSGLPIQYAIFLKDTLEHLSANEKSAIVLTTEAEISDDKYQADEDFNEMPEWSKIIDMLRKLNKANAD